MSGRTITIGTRGSDLALVQATATEALLGAKFPDAEIRRNVITTTGDRRTDVSLADVAKAEGTFDKGVFIKELEEALDDGSVDIAVHSLKDMPTVLDPRFRLAATLERAPVSDVLLTKQSGGLGSLKQGARVGTSSVRRAKQIEFLRPDVTVLDLRGNVPTRIRKLAEGDQYDAILLAEAGLVRLGFLSENETVSGFPGVFAHRLPESEFFPAAGQGAIGLEVRAAEREFLRLLDGGCHTPVGVYSFLEGGVISLFARVFPEEGGKPKTGQAKGADPITVARELFESLS
jgi:hydroxymethylbilane synthase